MHPIRLVSAVLQLGLLLFCYPKAGVCAPPPSLFQPPATTIEGPVSRISSWLVYGPLEAKAESDAAVLATNLSIEGLPWTGIQNDTDPAEIVITRQQKPNATTFLRRHMLDFYSLYLLDKSSQDKPSFVCITNLNAAENCETVLLVASDGLVRVTVNGETQAHLYERRPTHATYQASIPLKLHAGPNRLQIEVVRPTGSCGLQAVVCINPINAALEILETDRAFISELITPQSTAPGIRIVGAPAGLPYNIKVEPVIIVDEKERSPKKPSTGLYKAMLTLQERCFEEYFIAGDPHIIFEHLYGNLHTKALQKDASSHDLEAYKARFDLLYLKENIRENDREWQRKVVFIVETLAKLWISTNETQHKPKTLEGGISLHGFKSKIDGAVRHYRLFIPNGVKRENPRIPMLVMLPTAMSASRPFLASVFMSRQFEAEILSDLAQKNGFALLWSGYPCQPYGHPIERSHLHEVLADVLTHQPVDKERIYLLGTCRSAMTALMFAAESPGTFTGIGLLDPIVEREKDSADDEGKSMSFPDYCSWLQERAPLNLLAKLKQHPIFLVYDGPAPGHGTPEDALLLKLKAKETGVQIAYAEENSTMYHRMGWASVFRGLRELPLPPKKTRLSSIGSQTVTGPIAKLIAEPFAFVEGTAAADELTRTAMNRIVNAVRTNWKKNHFAEPRIFKDTEITEQLMQSYNLVVIGNSNSNSLWQKLAIPIDFERGSIAGKPLFAKNSTIVAIVNSPHQPARNIIALGSQNLASMELGSLNLATEGWFDFAAWTKCDTEGHPNFTEAGRYALPNQTKANPAGIR